MSLLENRLATNKNIPNEMEARRRVSNAASIALRCLNERLTSHQVAERVEDEAPEDTTTVVKEAAETDEVNKVAEVMSKTPTMVKGVMGREIFDVVDVSTSETFFVPISYKEVLKALLGKLYLAPPIYSCEKHGCDNKPSFISKIGFKIGQEKIVLLGRKADTRKGAEQDAALQAIMHLKRHFAIELSQDVNFLNLYRLSAVYVAMTSFC